MEKIVSYAQNREDVILNAFFPDIEHGYYVDIGASDPTKDSVTKFFYDRDWHGINVEPNPSIYKKLLKERPLDININAGVSNVSGKNLDFRIYKNGDGLSTFSDELKKEYKKTNSKITDSYKDIEVKTTSLSDLFSSNDVSHIHFMKVDAEGFEYEVLSANDWKKYRPEVICVEANHVTKDWRSILLSEKYTQVFFDGLNEYYVANESGRGDKFSYIKSIIGKRVIDSDTYWELNDLENRRMILDYQLQNSRKYTQELEEKIIFLNSHIFQQQRTKSLIKNLAINVDQIIMRNINKLTKKQHYYPSINTVNAKSIGKLLDAIRAADKEAFINKPTLAWKVKAFFGNIVLLLYRGFRKAVGVIGKLVFKKIIRPLVRMVKK